MKSISPLLYTGRGFTLIELLITVGILGILAAIVIIAINPQKQLEDARDAQRRTDLNTILNAVYQFQIKERRLPRRYDTAEAIPLGEPQRMDICQLADGFDCWLAAKAYLYELMEYDYLVALPEDPENDDSNGNGYEIWRTDDSRIHVRAPNFRNGEGLTVEK
jgi:type IV pilus assembly protein PilA